MNPFKKSTINNRHSAIFLFFPQSPITFPVFPWSSPAHHTPLHESKRSGNVCYLGLTPKPQLFASKYRTVLPTEAELIAELELERHVIERKQNGG
jgi:hypothetical protein